MLTEEMREIYLRESAYMAKNLSREGKIRGDIIVCHDPQPLAAISPVDRKKVWRAHIDLSYPRKEFVEFLLPFIERYDAAVFHFEEFILRGLSDKSPSI